MNVKKERSHSVFHLPHPLYEFRLYSVRSVNLIFLLFPIAYFIWKIYERVLITSGVVIASTRYWQGLILARGNARQYENEIGNSVY